MNESRYSTITLLSGRRPSRKGRLAAITDTHTHWSHTTESTEQWGQFHLWFFKEFGWYWFGAKVSSSFRQSGAFRSSWKELRPQPETEAETLSWNTRQQFSVGANNVSKHTITITAQTKANKHTDTWKHKATHKHMHTYMPSPFRSYECAALNVELVKGQKSVRKKQRVFFVCVYVCVFVCWLQGHRGLVVFLRNWSRLVNSTLIPSQRTSGVTVLCNICLCSL